MKEKILSLFGASPVVAEDAQIQTPSDRFSVFNVPQACPAAPEIGCGARAKPVLLELQRQPGIAEAWLSGTGTVLAVVWKEDCNCQSRVKAVQPIFEKNGLSTNELTGAKREMESKDFGSRHDWYYGSEVDSLTRHWKTNCFVMEVERSS